MSSATAAGICLPLESNHATKVTFHKDPAKLANVSFKPPDFRQKFQCGQKLPIPCRTEDNTAQLFQLQSSNQLFSC